MESEINLKEGTYEVIIAHGPGCNDGATAAWTVWRTLPRKYRDELAIEGGFYGRVGLDDKSITDESNDSTNESPEPDIHPNSPEGAMKLQKRGFPVVFVFVQPGESVPDKLVMNKRVLILDLDMGDALVAVVTAATSVLLVDHHASTPVTLHKHSELLFQKSGNKFATYVNTSKSESGASLAWRLTHSADIPPLVQVVRIGDTWQWNDYPELHARHVLKALSAQRTFRSLQHIEGTFLHWDQNFKSYVEKGHAVSEYETSLVERIAEQCDLGFIETNDGKQYQIAYVQCNVFISEVGAAMKVPAQKRFKVPIDFCATWKYIPHKDLVTVSLRDGGSDINLATIARTIKGSDGKGGGHDKAAGFCFTGIHNFHKFILKNPQESIISTNDTS
jgi:hypothetical protein